jgi:dihydrofolate synthase / folylpolyglutamate synthase
VVTEVDYSHGAAVTGMRFTRLSDWLAWQEGLHVHEIELGLERCQIVAGRMGLTAPEYRVFTVGGTNGKGSTVAMLDAILRAQGQRVGTYTSPHLLSYNERIRIDGEAVTDDRLCAAFQRVDAARGTISLTYFEFGTLAALSIFQASALDVAVLEVGLGGRLDAVNCVDADVAVLAAISIDHVEWLGPDRESIAREKAGIFRRGRPAVCSDPEPPGSLLKEAEATGCRLLLLNRDYRYEESADGTWSWFYGDRSYLDLPRPRLLGRYQYQNASGVLMALTALEPHLPLTENAIRFGLASVSLPGRFTLIPGAIEYVLDVAHNPQAAAVLAQTLRERPVQGATHAVIGMLKDKDRLGVFDKLSPLIDHWHVVGLSAPRGAPAERLVAELRTGRTIGSVTQYGDVATALAGARAIAKNADRILITGSFLTVAAGMRALADA